jgi:hypothetical protein
MSALRVTARALVVALAFLLPASLYAQQIGRITGLAGFEARGLSFQSGLGIKSVSEFAVPFGVVWPASTRLSFDVGGSYASVTRKDETGSQSLSGLTDIQARGVFQLLPDLAVLTVGVNLPTGKTKLTKDQLVAAGVVASDLIPFPVSSFGSGFNVTTGLALAVPVAGWALGAAGSYRQSGGFTLLADSSATYKAGGEFRVRLGADRIVGQSRVSLGLTYSTFGQDEFGGSAILQSGKRWISQASWSFPIGNLGLAVYAWDMYLGAGTYPINGQPVPKRNVLALGGVASLQMGKNVLRPQIEYRNHTVGVSQLSQAGKLLSLGARYQMPIGERYAVFPSARFDTGNVVNPQTAQAVSFTGWNFGVTLRATM